MKKFDKYQWDQIRDKSNKDIAVALVEQSKDINVAEMGFLLQLRLYFEKRDWTYVRAMSVSLFILNNTNEKNKSGKENNIKISTILLIEYWNVVAF